MADYFDDQSAPDTAQAAPEDASAASDTEKEDRTPESKLGLVQSSFFKGPVKPGDQEMVEVVDVYENEVSIKCVYGDEEDKEGEAPMEEPGMEGGAAPSEAEDAMMA